MKPTIGRIVHYFTGGMSPDGERELYAALIVSVLNDETVNLVAWDGDGMAVTGYAVKRGGDAGCWDWPARV